MKQQSYYFNEYGIESNIKNEEIPFQVNCCGSNLTDKKYTTLNNIRHDFYYLYLISGDFTFNGEELIAGDVIITPPETLYNCTSRNGFNYLWVHYTGEDALSFTQKKFGNLGRKQHIGLRRDICSIFNKMYSEFIISDESSKEICVCLLKEILSLTGRYIKSESNKTALLTSIKYIHEHYTEEIKIDDLAELEHMSPNNFRLMFKEHTSFSPNEYIIMQRLYAACSLLTQTNSAIEEIAHSVGYSDQYYFSRLFKKKFDLTPSKFRLENKVPL